MSKLRYLSLLVVLLFLFGCAGPKQPGTSGIKKACAELKGFSCQASEQCNGNLLAASDTSTCCSTKCQPKSSAPSEVEVPTFDFGKVDSDNSLGKLS